jgi:hypothetical protein
LSFSIYTDEHINPLVAVLLRQGGFDILTTQDADLANKKIPDDEQLRFATSRGRAILTHNTRDFELLARIWAEKGERHCGIILSNRLPSVRISRGVAVLQSQYPEGIQDLTLRLPRA